MKLEEDSSLVHDEETVEMMTLEAEELNFGQAEETAEADFIELEYLLDEEAIVEK
jgi:hypothetical protein